MLFARYMKGCPSILGHSFIARTGRKYWKKKIQTCNVNTLKDNYGVPFPLRKAALTSNSVKGYKKRIVYTTHSQWHATEDISTSSRNSGMCEALIWKKAKADFYPHKFFTPTNRPSQIWHVANDLLGRNMRFSAKSELRTSAKQCLTRMSLDHLMNISQL